MAATIMGNFAIGHSQLRGCCALCSVEDETCLVVVEMFMMYSCWFSILLHFASFLRRFLGLVLIFCRVMSFSKANAKSVTMLQNPDGSAFFGQCFAFSTEMCRTQHHLQSGAVHLSFGSRRPTLEFSQLFARCKFH